MPAAPSMIAWRVVALRPAELALILSGKATPRPGALPPDAAVIGVVAGPVGSPSPYVAPGDGPASVIRIAVAASWPAGSPARVVSFEDCWEANGG